MGVEYLVAGALITCPLGTKQEQVLLIPDDHGTYVGGKLVAREIDCEPIKNIPPFGICTFTQKPCVANFVGYKWLNTQEDSYVGGGSEAATTESFLVCLTGQTLVRPSDSGQGPITPSELEQLLMELLEKLLDYLELFRLDNLPSLYKGILTSYFSNIVDASQKLSEPLFNLINKIRDVIPGESEFISQLDRILCDPEAREQIIAQWANDSKNTASFYWGKVMGDIATVIGGVVGTTAGMGAIFKGATEKVLPKIIEKFGGSGLGTSLAGGGAAALTQVLGAEAVAVISALAAATAAAVEVVALGGGKVVVAGINNISGDWDAFQKAMTENGSKNTSPKSEKINHREVKISKSVDREAKKLSPEAKKGYNKAIEALKTGDTRGLNDHPLSGNRSGQRAIDIKGTGKGRGAGRIIYEYGENGEINVIEILTDHKY